MTGARFVESNVYDAPATLGERYDIVYTGLGVLADGTFHRPDGRRLPMMFSLRATKA